MKYTTVTSNKLPDEVVCPSSKSYANRALILGALKNVDTVSIHNLSESSDVKDLVKMYEQIGLEIVDGKTCVKIHNTFPECEVKSDRPIVLAGSEGGTTIRFLLPLLALGTNEYHLPLLGKMGQRPMDSLIQVLRSLGAIISVDESLIKVKGPINLDEDTLVSIDCAQTTQFASALTLLTLKYNFTIKYENLGASERYLALSKSLVNHFRSNNSFDVPVDFSSLGYFLAYAFLKQDLNIKNVTAIDELQADSALIDILKSKGAEIQINSAGLEIKKLNTGFLGFDLDGSQFIDLVPTLVFLACFASTASRFRNIQLLRIKECDRLAELEKILSEFEVEHQYDESKDILSIFPLTSAKHTERKLNLAHDHRMVMVASLFLKMLGDGQVSPTEAVAKSFPEFFNLF